MKLHDRIVARRLPGLANEIDVVHAWPLGALQTLETARDLGIPTVLERPNAHTRFAYEVVRRECERLDVALPPDHEHAYDEAILEREEAEYAVADCLLCPSEFVADTFLAEGYAPDRMIRHVYGYDAQVYYPDPQWRQPTAGLNALFVGVCAVRKGLHFALEAWLASPASRTGTLLIAGEFLPAYARRLAGLLEHPSVQVLGHREDVPELMRTADVLMLPSLEEGFPLTSLEAVASGCVPLVSDACSEVCSYGELGLVHQVGDVDALCVHLTELDGDRARLSKLRAGCLEAAPALTWEAAGRRLLAAYETVVAEPIAA